jgi:LysR family glycine cleavage system transcriptional activator
MARRLPPLNSLRAFEAAARHLSFKEAADELGVTPAAISQQVRALEEQCGRALFRRLTRALELTEAGRAALPLLTEGLDRLADGAEAMRSTGPSRVITVSTAPSFAAKWLLPRLEGFRARHPDYDVRLDATDALADFSRGGVDLAIRYGRGRYPGLVAECLMGETSFPVCAPALLERGPPLQTPEDLRNHTLLHIDWKMEHDSAPNWRMWLRAAGVRAGFAERGPRFSNDSLAVQAAVEGQGVALAGEALAGGDLAAGRLVRPFPQEIAQATAFCYYLVHPPGREEDARVSAFRDWLLEEARAAAGRG